MPNSSISARSSESLSIRGNFTGAGAGYQNGSVSSAAAGPSRSSAISYFFSEYIWSHLVLVLSLSNFFFIGRSEAGLFRTGVGNILKRAIDIIGALAGLILASPLFLIFPILIKLDSPGPVFYRQLRVGQNRRHRDRRKVDGSITGRAVRDRRRENIKGRPIKVMKFRTMVDDAEKKCGPIWATRNDPRITRLGRLLRKSRLDELPQLINVLKGEMALVGPRPERPIFVVDLCSRVEDYDKRLQVKPGITGLAQVENGYDSSVTSVVRKVHYDLKYIQNWSLRQDIKILLKTVIVVATGKGAF